MRNNMLQNVDIGGLGGVLASPDRNVNQGGSYYYAWMRDAGLTMRTLLRTFPNQKLIQEKFQHYTQWVQTVQHRRDPNQINVLGEPKFDLPKGEVYTGGWCRPQNDGPAIRATTLLLHLRDGAVRDARTEALVFTDLDYVASTWHTPGCDLWEEIRSDDLFWGLTHSLLAMTHGAALAAARQDTARHQRYQTAAAAITQQLQQHFDVQRSLIFETTTSGRELDTAVIGALRLYAEAGIAPYPFPPNAKTVAQTIAAYNDYFCSAFPINQAMSDQPGILYGRYEGDHYGGGNPWILSTAQLAGLLYQAAHAVQTSGTTDLAAWNNILHASIRAPTVAALPASLVAAGDGVMQRIYTLTQPYAFNLTEQLDKTSGAPCSAKDLTWSYSAVLSSIFTRQQYFS